MLALLKVFNIAVLFLVSKRRLTICYFKRDIELFF